MRAIYKAVGVRLLYGLPVLALVTFGAAELAELMPGSPGRAILGDNASAEQVAALNTQYGYDRPVLARYWDWLWNALHGDLGQTLFSHESVLGLLAKRAAVTVELTFLALALSLIIALPLALYAALRQNGIVDRTLHLVSSTLLCIPAFISALVLSYVMAGQLKVLPATGWTYITDGIGQNLKYAILPAIALAVYETAFFYRVFRTDVLSTLREDFVLVARAKGLSTPYILMRHVFRPSMSSLVTVLGLSLGRLLGGAIIVENFFAVPGLGFQALSSVSTKDMAVLQAIVSLAVVVYVVIFIVVDLAYAWIDPRIGVR